MQTIPNEIAPGRYQCSCGHVACFQKQELWDAREKSYRKRWWLTETASLEPHTLVLQDGTPQSMLCPQSSGRHLHVTEVHFRIIAVGAGLVLALCLLACLTFVPS